MDAHLLLIKIELLIVLNWTGLICYHKVSSFFLAVKILQCLVDVDTPAGSQKIICEAISVWNIHFNFFFVVVFFSPAVINNFPT